MKFGKLIKLKESRRRDTTTIIVNTEIQISRDVIIKRLTLKKNLYKIILIESENIKIFLNETKGI